MKSKIREEKYSNSRFCSLPKAEARKECGLKLGVNPLPILPNLN
jgi:hypothetical protein